MSFINTEWRDQNSRVKWIVSGIDYNKLTGWEAGFVESVEKQSNQRKMLSDNKDGMSQMELLEKIYREKGR